MDNDNVKNSVMKAIREGRVRMRSRARFVALSVAVVACALVLLFVLTYAVSLAVFFLRDGGLILLPGLGSRGWFLLFSSMPWLLLLLILAFVIVLEIVVRRFTVVYRKPLIASVLGILGLIFVAGFALSLTPLHRRLARFDREGQLPGAIAFLYSSPFRTPLPPHVIDGTVQATTSDGFVLADEEGEGTTTVLVGPRTRLPDGANFQVGELVVIIGDPTDATGTVRAFGVRYVSGPEQ